MEDKNLIKRVSRQFFGSYNLSYRKLCTGIWYVVGNKAKGFVVDTAIWREIFDTYITEITIHGGNKELREEEQHYAVFTDEVLSAYVYWMCFDAIWFRFAKLNCRENATERELQQYAQAYLLFAKRAVMMMDWNVLKCYPKHSAALAYKK